MRRRRAVPLLAALVLPGAVVADIVAIPQIGIRMLDLPSDATVPRVSQLFTGDLAALRIGEAQLTIFRLQDPVPAGTSVLKSGDRTNITADFHDRLANPHEQAVSIAGHDAWSMCSSSGFVGNAQYTCIRYAVVEDHLYRFRAYLFDNTKSKQIPPNFDRAVRAMSAVAFEPVQRTDHGGESSRPPQLPKFSFHLTTEAYPAAAKVREEQGVVDVEFSIDSRGRARDIQELYVQTPHLKGAVAGLLDMGLFKVPADWEQQGFENQRYSMQFQFALTAGSKCFAEYPSAPGPGVEVVQTCVSLL